jgi:hypothetical protein
MVNRLFAISPAGESCGHSCPPGDRSPRGLITQHSEQRSSRTSLEADGCPTMRATAQAVQPGRMLLVRPEGLEPPAFWSVARRSVQIELRALRRGGDSNPRGPQQPNRFSKLIWRDLAYEVGSFGLRYSGASVRLATIWQHTPPDMSNQPGPVRMVYICRPAETGVTLTNQDAPGPATSNS